MSVIDLDDMKDYLGLAGTNASDDKLQAEIDAAEATFAARCGPLASTEQTWRVSGGDCVLLLPVGPVIDLVSITPYQGAALTFSDLFVDTRRNTVEYNSGVGFYARYYTVVYNAGYSPLPSDLEKGVKELVRFNWQSSQRGPQTRGGASRSDQVANTVPGSNREFPFEVERIMARYAQMVAG